MSKTDTAEPIVSAEQANFQLFDSLPKPIEDALRFSIQRFGVLVPVAKDQYGRTLDGYHRSRIADELGVKYRVDVIHVESDEQAREIAYTLNADRRQLDPEQRKTVAVEMVQAGHSMRATASALGVSHTQIRRDVAGGTYVPPDSVIGQDGKHYPARRPPVVAAKNLQEAERAQIALASIDAPPSSVMDIRRVERIARENEAERRREQPTPTRTSFGGIDIRLGDFRDALADLAPQSVDAIITDPPYEREYWDRYEEDSFVEDLGWLAQRILKHDGILAILTGTRLEMLYTVDEGIGRFMRRRWWCAYLTPGQRWRDQLQRVATGWKPLLIYCHPEADERRLRWINDDVFTSAGTNSADQRYHHWGQNELGFRQIVERLTDPGALVVDPFLGGGTTAVACRDLGRTFIGCDIDPASVQTARERLALEERP